jgi:hypothetical protein
VGCHSSSHCSLVPPWRLCKRRANMLGSNMNRRSRHDTPDPGSHRRSCAVSSVESTSNKDRDTKRMASSVNKSRPRRSYSRSSRRSCAAATRGSASCRSESGLPRGRAENMVVGDDQALVLFTLESRSRLPWVVKHAEATIDHAVRPRIDCARSMTPCNQRSRVQGVISSSRQPDELFDCYSRRSGHCS